MKRLVFFITFSLTVQFALAQSRLIHYWHFNNFYGTMYTDTIQPIPADYSIMASSQAKILYKKIAGTTSAYSTYIDSFTTLATRDFDTMNLRMGQPGGNAIRTRNPSDSMELVFAIPSTNYKNLVLKYGTQGSSRTSGMLLQLFDYSVDSGATWKTSGLNIAQDSAGVITSVTGKPCFKLVSINFGSDTTVNNNSKLLFRIKFSGNTTGTSGNNRFDNVTLDGDSVTASTHTAVPTVTATTNEIKVYPNPVNNHLNIATELEGDKLFTILNVTGETVAAGYVQGKNVQINVAELAAGTYMVKLIESTNGATYWSKFVKQ